MNKLNWDDLRFVLAVAETGSVNRAGQRLGVTHATVLRRIAAFEEQVGEAVFRKARSGYEVLPGKMSVIENARRVQDVMSAVTRDLKGQQTELSGEVRITSTDSLSQFVLPAIVAKIVKKHPGLELTLQSGNHHVDFGRLSSDIAVRPALELNDMLVGERVGDLGGAVYRAVDGRNGWLGLSGALKGSSFGKWMAENVPQSEISQSADSFLVLKEMVALGQGQAFLPCFVGDQDPKLQRLINQPVSLSVPIWVAVQKELADSARLKVVSGLLASELREIAPQLAGEYGQTG